MQKLSLPQKNGPAWAGKVQVVYCLTVALGFAPSLCVCSLGNEDDGTYLRPNNAQAVSELWILGVVAPDSWRCHCLLVLS